MFQYSFEKNDTEKLIEGSQGLDGNANPAENIINVFMEPENRVSYLVTNHINVFMEPENRVSCLVTS